MKAEISSSNVNQEAITKAGEIINLKTDYIGNGMEGYATVTTIDEDGCPSSSTLSISKADGINWITFNIGLDSNPAKRISDNNRICVCLSSSEYHINLVGTAEVLTDMEIKKENWQEPLREYYPNGYEDAGYVEGCCVLRFHTKRYNLYIVDGKLEAKGTL